MILLLALTAREYFHGALNFITTMYEMHRFEFKRHAFRVILLSSVTLATVCYVFLGVYFLIVISSCYLSQMNMHKGHMNDLCFEMFPKRLTPDLASETYFIFIIFELLPFALYFIL